MLIYPDPIKQHGKRKLHKNLINNILLLSFKANRLFYLHITSSTQITLRIKKRYNQILYLQLNNIMGNNQSTPSVLQTPVTSQSATQNTTQVATPVDPSQTTASVVASSPSQQYSIKSFANCATDFLQQVGPWIHTKKAEFGNNPLSTTYSEYSTSFQQQVQSPLCQLYNTVPQKFTEAKFELISPYSYNQRFTTLNILCALTAIATLTSSKLNPLRRVLISTRNAGVMYFVGGLMVAPEIYNPFLKKW